MYKARWFILAIVAAWFGIAIWRSTNFKPATEALKMLDDDHELSILQDSLRYDYHTGEYDNTIQVNFIWGIEDVDKSGVNRWDASNLGTIEWDNNFDMSSEANQQRLLDICNNLKASSLVKDQQVTCWVQDFVNAQNGGNPVPQANFYTELETYLATTTGQNQYSDNQIGYINGRLYFIKFEALSVAIPFQGYEILEPVYDDWENLKDNYNKNSPIGINNSFQTAAFHWAFLVTEKAFVSGAIQGTLISMLFAFLVLLFSTLNIMIALYSILSIGGIVVSAISVMEMSGWTLGIIESIAMVILIGFSVDYVVHLANHYVESVYEDRYRKMQESLGSIGISILSGAITTFG
jgi:protein dispatched 1